MFLQILITWFLCMDGPPVEGDITLARLILDAQQANLTRFSCGELRATYKSTEGSKNPRTLNVRVIWKGDKAYWEFDEQRERVDKRGDKIDVTPTYGRMVFNGKNYILYYPGANTTGRVVIFVGGENEMSNALGDYENIDLRPQVRWALAGPLRPWAEIIVPHPNFPSDKIRKWVVRQKGDRVIVERHEELRGAESVCRIEASLDLSGHVVAFDYDAPTYHSRREFTWHKEADGTVILDRDWEHRKTSTLDQETELLVKEFRLQPVIGPEQFEISALQIKTGAVVQDQIQGKRYTYKGRNVDQKALDELSDRLRSRGKTQGKLK